MLDDLIDHFDQTKNKSLIARIYGVFTLKTKIFDPVDFMIMQNTALVEGDRLCQFDLKGSLVNRKTMLQDKRISNKSEADLLLDGHP